jgi:hypothetical protein
LIREILMRNIDRQRVAAVRTIEHLGYPLAGHKRLQPANDTAAPLDADALFALIIERAAELASRLARCTDGSDEERELEAIADAINTYEAVRWPGGKVAGGKG